MVKDDKNLLRMSLVVVIVRKFTLYHHRCVYTPLLSVRSNFISSERTGKAAFPACRKESHESTVNFLCSREKATRIFLRYGEFTYDFFFAQHRIVFKRGGREADNDKKCLCERKMKNNLGFFTLLHHSFHHVFIRWIFLCVLLLLCFASLVLLPSCSERISVREKRRCCCVVFCVEWDWALF